MRELVYRMDSVDKERERKRAVEREVTCHREDCFPGRVALIYKGISASAEGEHG